MADGTVALLFIWLQYLFFFLFQRHPFRILVDALPIAAFTSPQAAVDEAVDESGTFAVNARNID